MIKKLRPHMYASFEDMQLGIREAGSVFVTDHLVCFPSLYSYFTLSAAFHKQSESEVNSFLPSSEWFTLDNLSVSGESIHHSITCIFFLTLITFFFLCVQDL